MLLSIPSQSHLLKARCDAKIERETYHYCAHSTVTAVQVQRDTFRLRVSIMLDPYFSSDGSARRMEGKVLAVCVWGDAR